MERITQSTKAREGKLWKINKIKTFLRNAEAIV